MLSAGPRVWRLAIRNLIGSIAPQRTGGRLRSRRRKEATPGWNVAAEVMEERAMLSGPAYGEGFTSIFQSIGVQPGAAYVNGNSLTTDSTGNIYASISYWGTGNINPLGSAYTITNPGTPNPGVQAIFAKYNSSLNLQWALAPTLSSTQVQMAFGKAAVGANSGDLYLSGSVAYGSATFTTATGTTVTVTAPANGGMSFVMRLDHNTGNVVWLAQGLSANEVATDAAENVYLMGSAKSATYTPVYGITNAGVPVSLTGSSQPYFLKLNSSGTALWSGEFGSGVSNSSFQRGGGPDMAVDPAGNVYFIGTLSGTTDVDPSSNVKNLTSVGYGDVLIEKINTNGGLVWAIQNGKANTWSNGQYIQVDANGNLDCSGGFNYLTGGTKKNPIYTSGNLAQFDNNGNRKWLVSQTNQTGGAHFAIDAAGNLYFSGYAGPSNMHVPALYKYAGSTGALDWSATFGSASTGTDYTLSQASSLAVDSAGNIWWSGGFYDPSGQINVSPTSTPVYLAADTTGNGTLGIVEWTQPGGFAAAATQQSGSSLAASSPTAGTTTTASTLAQPVIYIGDSTPPTTLLVVPTKEENTSTFF